MIPPSPHAGSRAVTLLEEVRHVQAQRAHHSLDIAVGKALEQDVTFGVRADAQAWVLVSAPPAVSQDRTTCLVAVTLFAHVLQAIQDAFQGSHAPTPQPGLGR